MADKIIKIKRSSVAGKAPANGSLEPGELAVNLADGKIFTGDSIKDTIAIGGVMTDAQVKIAYEANTDTNAFDDIAKDRVAENRYYLDLREEQVLGFNGMYSGIDIVKDGYTVNSTAQNDTGVFVGTYVADQDVGGSAEAKILVGTLNRDNPIEPTQGTIYVYKTGSMAFVSSVASTTIIDDVTTGGSTEALSAEQGKMLQDTKVGSIATANEIRIPEMIEMTQVNYDALGAGRPKKLYIIVG